MKTAIYIEDGFTQIVLTPESEFETTALSALRKANSVTVKEGMFYHCQGGWVREGGERDSAILIAHAKQ